MARRLQHFLGHASITNTVRYTAMSPEPFQGYLATPGFGRCFSVSDLRYNSSDLIPKSNWANTIDQPPFEAYAVTCGLTFTFGGLKIDTGARVMDTDGMPIPGLFAAGELVGGIFYFNYPGGTGLMNGAVFGRIAGTSAGQGAARIR